MPETAQDVLALAEERGAQIVDLWFCDLPGLMQHFSIPVEELTEEGFVSGYGFDGSSIRGFQAIHESDMLLIPDPSTAFVDPFYEIKTLVMNCNVIDPITRQHYDRDPRWIARKAELRLPEDARTAASKLFHVRSLATLAIFGEIFLALEAGFGASVERRSGVLEFRCSFEGGQGNLIVNLIVTFFA